MDNGTSLHVGLYQGHLFFNIHVILRKSGDTKTVGTIFKD